MGDNDHLSPEALAVEFRARYASFQYHLVEFLTEHLTDVSRAFGGDLQEMLALALIGQMQLKAHIAIQAGRPPPDASLSASRIADITGIPRQTVRRKLKSMVDRGWIEQTQDASYRLVVRQQNIAEAHFDLADLDQRGIERTARLFAGLERLLKTRP